MTSEHEMRNTTKDTALRLALEALENATTYTGAAGSLAVDEAIAACREALAQPAGERGELIRKAMRKAYSLGQTYWQQADSEFTSHHKKADVTQAKFIALVEETAALLSSDAQPSEWVGLSDDAWKLAKKKCGLLFSDVVHMNRKQVEAFARAIEAKLREKNAGKPAAEDKAGGDEPVATGTWEHLKLMMEESAWDGKIELADALANIVDFEKYYTRPQPQAAETT